MVLLHLLCSSLTLEDFMLLSIYWKLFMMSGRKDLYVRCHSAVWGFQIVLWFHGPFTVKHQVKMKNQWDEWHLNERQRDGNSILSALSPSFNRIWKKCEVSFSLLQLLCFFYSSFKLRNCFCYVSKNSCSVLVNSPLADSLKTFPFLFKKCELVRLC